MKKLIFLLILIPIFLKAQYVLPDFEIADSLVAGTDTSQVINLSFGGTDGYSMGEWWIAAKDTGSTYKDSVAMFAGFVRHNVRTYASVDTFWTRIMFKDSVFGNVGVIQASATQSLWTPLVNMPFLLKIDLINAEFVDGRRWDYTIQAKKIKQR